MVNLILKRMYKDEKGNKLSKKILETKAFVSILNEGVCVTILDMKLGEKIEKVVKNEGQG